MVAVSPLSSRQEESVDGSGGGGGGEQCDSSKEWGQLGQDIQNGTACVNECLERFRRDVLKDAAPDDPTENQDLLLCKALSASEKGVGDTKQNGGGEGRKGMRRGTARFNHLYCCDSVVCGIWFNKTAGADPQGQDPNVLKIVHDCHSKGFADVIDPGIPDGSLICPADWTYRSGEREACETARKDGLTTPSVAGDGGNQNGIGILGLPPSTKSLLPVSFREHRASSTSSLLSQIIPPATLPTAASSGEQLATAPPETLGPVSASPSSRSKMPTPTSHIVSKAKDQGAMDRGIKVTIATASVVGCLVALGLLLWLYRRRQQDRQYQSNSLRSRITHHSHLPGSGRGGRGITFVSSSISSSGGRANNSSMQAAVEAQTPPLRLKDRKLIPGISSRKSAPLFTPEPQLRTAGTGFPTSPICAPTTSKLTPRHERTPKIFGGGAGMGKIREGTSSSSSSNQENPTGRGAVESTQRGPLPPRIPLPSPDGSPTRPPRPHNEPLEIPDLVSPGPGPGAPPSKALPSPRLLVSPASPTPSTSCNAVGMDFTPTPPTGPRSPTTGSKLPSSGIGIAIGGDPAESRNYAYGAQSTAVSSASSSASNGSSVEGNGAADVPILAMESQALHDLTQEYARETMENRISWGSWGGTGGGGAAVGGVAPVPTSPRKRSGSSDGFGNPVLKEGELERMGGKYI